MGTEPYLRCGTRLKAGSAFSGAGIIVNRCHEHDRTHRAAVSAHRPPRVPPRRHRQGARPRGGGDPRARAGVPGRGDPPAGRGHPRDVHGPQDQFGVGVERTFPVHSPSIAKLELVSRGRRPPGQALLPARPAREEGARSRSAGSTTPSSPPWRPRLPSPRPKLPRPKPRPRPRRRGRRRRVARGRRRTRSRRAEDAVESRRCRRRYRSSRRRDGRRGARRRPRPDRVVRAAVRPRRRRRALPTTQHRGRFRELSVLIVLGARRWPILIKTFLVQAFFIPSPSMVPTLHQGDRILVCRICLHGSATSSAATSWCSPIRPRATTDDRGLIGGVVHWLGEGIGVARPRGRGLHQAGGRPRRARRGDPRRATCS